MRRWRVLTLTALAALAGARVHALDRPHYRYPEETITTPEIVLKTLAAMPACFDWRPVGMCFWLKCSWHGCTIKTSVKVAHNTADLVVPVYNDLHHHPITDIGQAIGAASAVSLHEIVYALSGGAQTQIGSQGGRTEDPATSVGDLPWDRRTLIFREADAIGNPTSLVLGIAASAVDAGLSGGLSGALSLPSLSDIAEAFTSIDLSSLTGILDDLDLPALADLKDTLDPFDLSALTQLPDTLSGLRDQLSQLDVSELTDLSNLTRNIDLDRLSRLTGLDFSGLSQIADLPALIEDFNATQALSALQGISNALSALPALQNLALVADVASRLSLLGDVAGFFDLARFAGADGLPGRSDFSLTGFSLPGLSSIPSQFTGGSSIDAGSLVSAAPPVPSLADFLCPAGTTAFLPHFQSGLDALVWRDFIPAEAIYPATLIPGMREVGHWPANTWGSVHPRIGFIATQPVVPKAAAVIAQRAGDIVTRAGQPHVYIATDQGVINKNGYRVWMPPPLVEGDSDTGTWQMLRPHSEHECKVFGENDVFAPPTRAWADDKYAKSGDYVWNLWRPYACCRKRGHFLFDIGL